MVEAYTFLQNHFPEDILTGHPSGLLQGIERNEVDLLPQDLLQVAVQRSQGEQALRLHSAGIYQQIDIAVLPGFASGVGAKEVITAYRFATGVIFARICSTVSIIPLPPSFPTMPIWQGPVRTLTSPFRSYPSFAGLSTVWTVFPW